MLLGVPEPADRGIQVEAVATGDWKMVGAEEGKSHLINTKEAAKLVS